jgi:toxin ParE1/3/4
MVDELLGRMRWLADSGFSGSARDKVRPGLRALSHRDRSIYFRIEGDAVRILRVIHQRRDLRNQDFDKP